MSVSSVMLSLSWECKLEAIDQVRQAHVAALNSGDVDAWAALFSEDGVQMPPHVPANVGRPTIHGWSQEFLRPFHAQFALEVDEVRVGGEWAFERAATQSPSRPRREGHRSVMPASTSLSTSGRLTTPGR
jgi:uncharacterized protein (TIGR02246 family)